jgi:hypothetical protein
VETFAGCFVFGGIVSWFLTAFGLSSAVLLLKGFRRAERTLGRLLRRGSTTVSRWETGRTRRPTSTTLRRVQQFLGSLDSQPRHPDQIREQEGQLGTVARSAARGSEKFHFGGTWARYHAVQ